MKEAKSRLENLIKSGVSAAAIARALGVSPSAISTFRKGEYKGNSEELAQKIKQYTQNYSKKETPVQQVFLSKDFKMALGIIDIAVEEREIGVITGEAGSGKSTAAREYAKSHPNAILIEATLHTTAKVLLEELCAILKIHGGRSLHGRVLAISEHLKKSDVVILIDEAEHLPVRALEDLRRIWDFSGVPIILIGTEILMRNLKGKSGELKQLYSRICGIWHMRGLSEEEVSEFFNPYIYAYTLGNFRASFKLSKMSNRLCAMHEVEICGEVVKEAATMIIL